MPSDIEVTDELRLAFDEATGQLDPNPELLSALKRRHSQRQHRRRAVLVSVTATVAVVAALSGATLMSDHNGGDVAYAETPPNLHYSLGENAPNARQLLLQLADKAAAQPEPPSGRYDYVETRGWYFNTTVVGDDGMASGRLTPNQVRTWLAADGSGRIIDEVPGRSPRIENVPNKDFPNGLEKPVQLPTDPSALRKKLAENHPGYGTFEWFVAVSDVSKQQVVTPQVEAGLLRMLAQESDIVDSGNVVDRAGRNGVAVSTESDHSGAPTRYTLIFEPATGALLDYEETALASPKKMHLRVPATLSYTVWLKAGRVDTIGATP